MAHSIVTVTLIDDASSATMATVDLPISDLPETFELETTLHLGDEDWAVVSAEPQSRLAFAGSGKLVLRLRKIEQIPVSDILYSLPSICDRLPAVADTRPGGNDLMLDEDDWRQIELVSRAFADESEAEIAAIRAIHEKECAGVGWKKIHVRGRPDPPIASALTREDIGRAFGGVTFHGVCLAGSPVISGFSFQADNLRCYGVEEEGTVSVFGVVQEPGGGHAAETLSRIAREFDLDLVH